MNFNQNIQFLTNRYLNIILFAAAFPFYFIFNSIADGFGNAVIVINLFYIVSLLLNMVNKIQWSNVTLLTNTIMGTFYYSYSLPLESGVYNLFYAILLFPFLLFKYNQRFLIILFTLIPALMLVTRVSSVFSDVFFIYNIHNIKYVHSFSVAIISIIIILFTFFFIREIYFAQQELSQKNYDLKRALINLKKSRNDQILLTQYAEYAKLVQRIAHEFKNPLQMLQGTAELGLKKNQATDLFKIVLQSVDRLNYVIQPMLNYLNTEENYKFEPFNLANTVNDIVILSSANCQSNNIEITIQNNLKNSIAFGDSKAVGQIFINLITNAIDAIGNNGGKIMIDLINQSFINEEKEVNGIKIDVIDNGCGIDQDSLKRIFVPYESSRKTKKNIGLGLSIVSKIIKDHNGLIKIDSIKNEGTTISIFLPVSYDEVGPISKDSSFELDDSFFSD